MKGHHILGPLGLILLAVWLAPSMQGCLPEDGPSRNAASKGLQTAGELVLLVKHPAAKIIGAILISVGTALEIEYILSTGETERQTYTHLSQAEMAGFTPGSTLTIRDPSGASRDLTLAAERRAIAAERQLLEDQQKALEDQRRALAAERRALERSREAGRTPRREDDRLSKPPGFVIITPKRVSPPAEIRGQVTGIEGTLAEIDLGSSDGVGNGQSLAVFRPSTGNAYIGELRISVLRDRRAAGSSAPARLKVGDTVILRHPAGSDDLPP